MTTRTISVDWLARVEGEGALYIKMEGDRAIEVQLRIFEPPRLFEALLRGRDHAEAPDITSRICGICPVAYQLTSCHALEAAAGVVVDGALRALRRLMYFCEWIESHALHVFLLHAPDFLGFPDAITMARKHPEVVRRGLRMKKAGNAVITLLGGREIHPVNVRLGGFYRAPTKQELATLRPELQWGRDAARESLEWARTLPFPNVSRDFEFVALRHPDEYAICEGRLVSSKGLDISAAEFEDEVVETQVSYSNALHATLRGRGAYLCGPLSRIQLNFDRLPSALQDAARASGIAPPCGNPFRSILARLIEIELAFTEAIRLIDAYEAPPIAALDVTVRRARGAAITEAPRGALYHRYEVDENGLIREAKIVPPTSQNQRQIELDLFELAPLLASLPLEEATWMAEQAVRNYDPCISCATHFLRLEIER